MQVQTTSVMIQSLCLPCYNRCRYCLLSWNGTIAGAPWEQSVDIAERFLKELKAFQPSLNCSFVMGSSMEHPDLREAIRVLRRLNSPMADFLQCDGMKMRDDAECDLLMTLFREEGVKSLNFTIYGLQEYHDRFAGRMGDFDLLFRMMRSAKAAGIPFSTGIPVTAENVLQIDRLVSILDEAGSDQISLFIPHEEGRGKNLQSIRLTYDDFFKISEKNRALLNQSIYRTESQWLQETEPVNDTQRMIIISLREDNVSDLMTKSAGSVLHEIEMLDEAYYASFPSFHELAAMYGDPQGMKMYRIRDLYYHYRKRFGEEHNLHVYDVTDERFSGSRRF